MRLFEVMITSKNRQAKIIKNEAEWKRHRIRETQC